MTDFSFSSVADKFDEHIRKSIHGYDNLFETVVGMSKSYIKNETYVLDIGCSQGTLIRTIEKNCPVNIKHDIHPEDRGDEKYDVHGKTYDPIYIGLDIDESFMQHWEPHWFDRPYNWNRSVKPPILFALADIGDWEVDTKLTEEYKNVIIGYMWDKYTVFPMKNFSSLSLDEKWKITKEKMQTSAMIICDDYDKNETPKFSFITSLFTFQFLKRATRDKTVENIKKVLHPEGAFVVAEKINSDDGDTQNLYEFLNIDYKRKSFSEKEILDKEQSLRKMAHYFTEKELMSYYSQHFKVSVFWRNLNFIGLLCRRL